MQRDNTGKQGSIHKAKATRIISNFEMAELVKKQPKLPVYKPDSFPSISKHLDGFMPGELIVITGGTKCGKTLFCQTLVKDFCKQELYPLVLFYEDPPKYYINKFSLLLQFYMPEKLEPYDLIWIQEIVKIAVSDKAVKVVFIDHLHYIFKMSNTTHASLDIGYIMRSLKQLALETETVIFLVCHTTKANIVTKDEVGVHSIRDSSFVAQESDSAIFIHRKGNEALAKILTARRSGCMDKIVYMVKADNFLAEMA